jgi:hypothetical protein
MRNVPAAVLRFARAAQIAAACVVMALLLPMTALAGAGGNGSGKGNATSPLPAAQATALMNASTGSTAEAVRPASVGEVLAASVQPGSETQGAAPAVAMAATTGALTAATATYCWEVDSGWEWGTIPYEQDLDDITYWCAAYGSHITYVDTVVNASSRWLCDSSDGPNIIIGGGVGYSYVVERVYGNWSCPTVIPWVTLHSNHYLDTSFNDWGNSSQVDSG